MTRISAILFDRRGEILSDAGGFDQIKIIFFLITETRVQRGSCEPREWMEEYLFANIFTLCSDVRTSRRENASALL